MPSWWLSVQPVPHGPDNGLSPIRRQAITWTNTGLLSIKLLETNFSEIRIGILSHLKMSSAKMAAILSIGWVGGGGGGSGGS